MAKVLKVFETQVLGTITIINMQKALQISNLRKIYANGPEALKGVDLEVKNGDFFALLGPNGAGKSTLIGILTGLVQKTSGTVSVYGHDLDREVSQVKASLGVVPQEFNFNAFETVINTVVFQAGYYGIPRDVAMTRAESLLRSLALWEKRDQPGRNLSGGMKRRLMLARALVNEPKLLILDEPTAGLDIELRRSLWDFLIDLNNRGTTIILTTHYLEEAESLCRNIAIINHGEIVTNTSIKNLLRELHRETFILDAREPLPEGIHVPGFELSRIDDFSLEAHIEQGQDLAELMSRLHEAGVSIISMRNRENRLEQMFVSLLEQAS